MNADASTTGIYLRYDSSPRKKKSGRDNRSKSWAALPQFDAEPQHGTKKVPRNIAALSNRALLGFAEG